MSNKYILGIDGIRALAVISVIIFHLFPNSIPGGFVGVYIFFVISGYVVTGSLISSYTPKLSSFILDFYERRLFRLYPLFNDGDHLTGFGNAYLYQDFLQLLDKIVNREKNN